MRRFLSSLWLVLAALLLGEARAARPGYVNPDGTVAIVGYNDMDDLIARWDRLYEGLHPEVRFKPDLPSTRSAPPALARGASLFAPMGAEMSGDQIAPCIAADGRAPIMIRVAHASVSPLAKSGPIAVVVHASNPLRSLTTAALAALFAGPPAEATWGSLDPGSPVRDQPVHAFALDSDTPLSQYMVRDHFGGQPVAGWVRTFHQSRDVLAAVAADPLAIGFAAANGVGPAVRAVPIAPAPGAAPVPCDAASVGAGRYPLDRFLVVYLRHPAGGTLDPLAVAYVRLALSGEGQAEVARTRQAYLPLTPAEASAQLAGIDGILAADRSPIP